MVATAAGEAKRLAAVLVAALNEESGVIDPAAEAEPAPDAEEDETGEEVEAERE
jgi:hypothetical protein